MKAGREGTIATYEIDDDDNRYLCHGSMLETIATTIGGRSKTSLLTTGGGSGMYSGLDGDVPVAMTQANQQVSSGNQCNDYPSLEPLSKGGGSTATEEAMDWMMPAQVDEDTTTTAKSFNVITWNACGVTQDAISDLWIWSVLNL